MKRFTLVLVVLMAFGMTLSGCASVAGDLLNLGLNSAANLVGSEFHKHYVMTDQVQKADFPALDLCRAKKNNIWVCLRKDNSSMQDIYFIIPRTSKPKRDAKLVRVSRRKEQNRLKAKGGTIVFGSTLKASELITTKKMAERYTGWWLAFKE